MFNDDLHNDDLIPGLSILKKISAGELLVLTLILQLMKLAGTFTYELVTTFLSI